MARDKAPYIIKQYWSKSINLDIKLVTSIAESIIVKPPQCLTFHTEGGEGNINENPSNHRGWRGYSDEKVREYSYLMSWLLVDSCCGIS